MTRFDPDGRVLMTVQFRKPTAELLYQLEHDPSIVGRIWAARQLASASGDRREIVRALRERLARDSFWAVSAAVAGALGEMRTDETREALAEGLKNRDPRVRQATVRALGRFFRDREADELVRKVYESDRSPVTAAEAGVCCRKNSGPGSARVSGTSLASRFRPGRRSPVCAGRAARSARSASMGHRRGVGSIRQTHANSRRGD